MYAQPGPGASSFNGRSGCLYPVGHNVEQDQQGIDFPPEDVALALRNGWVTVPKPYVAVIDPTDLALQNFEARLLKLEASQHAVSQ